MKHHYQVETLCLPTGGFSRIMSGHELKQNLKSLKNLTDFEVYDAWVLRRDFKGVLHCVAHKKGGNVNFNWFEEV